MFQNFVDTLYRQARVSKSGPQGLAEFRKFQDLLIHKRDVYRTSFQLYAYNSPNRNDLFFEGWPHQYRQPNHINLGISKTHVYLILKLHQFLNKTVCPICSHVYSNGLDHSCTRRCPDCNGWQCFGRQKLQMGSYNPKSCTCCNCAFFDQQCFNKHKNDGICKKYVSCLDCFKVVQREQLGWRFLAKVHECSKEVRCRFCHNFYPPPNKDKGIKPHYCHIKSLIQWEFELPMNTTWFAMITKPSS